MKHYVRILNLSTVALALLGLAACKVDSRSEVFTSDILEAADGSARTAPTTIRFEVSSRTQCESALPRVSTVLEKYFTNSKKVECLKEGLDDYVTFQADAPIFKLEGVMTGIDLAGGHLLGFGVVPKDHGGHMFYAALNPKKLAAITADFKSIFNQEPKVELRNIAVLVQNDSNRTFELEGPSAFVDGQPRPFFSAMIKRREKLTIQLSNVTALALRSESLGYVFELQE